MSSVAQMAARRSAFRPKRYAVTFEMLKAWREAGESTITIASRFGCDHTTVWNWLVRLGLQTKQPTLIAPTAEPPGKAPITKLAVYEAERASRKSQHPHNPKPQPRVSPRSSE